MTNGKKKMTAAVVSAVLALSVLGLTWATAVQPHAATTRTEATQWPPAQGSSTFVKGAPFWA